MEAILSLPSNQVRGFLAAGHVCAIMGYHQYFPLSSKYQIPIVITGFEPVDILLGIYKLIIHLEKGGPTVINAYNRSVTEWGNIPAQKLLREIFEPVDRKWRGIGMIPMSGLKLRSMYSEFDAELKFGLANIHVEEPKECEAGKILQGIKKPDQCKSFGRQCTPEKPKGAPMVSSEGACAAYYKYRSSNAIVK